MLTLSATGHRPNKLGSSSPDLSSKLDHFAIRLLQQHTPSLVLSGMALGWDTAIAEAALLLDIPLVCIVPFPQQPSRWPLEAICRWRGILRRARETIIVSKEYSPRAFQARNEVLVDRADILLALWNGTSGGTGNCLQYAWRKPLSERPEIVNCWESWVKVRGNMDATLPGH